MDTQIVEKSKQKTFLGKKSIIQSIIIQTFPSKGLFAKLAIFT